MEKELEELTEYLYWRIDNPRNPMTAKDVLNFFYETGWLLPFVPITHEMFYPRNFKEYKDWKKAIA